MSGNTHPESSQGVGRGGDEVAVDLARASVHVDELFVGGIVRWDSQEVYRERWGQLEAVKAHAEAERQAVRFPFIPGAYDADLLPHGTGRGRETFLAYALRVGPGGCIWVDLDPREAEGRQLYNLRVRLTGTACLVFGVEKARETAMRVVAWLGGELVDDWVKRIDLCLDMPGVPVAPFVKAFVAGRYVSTSKFRQVHQVGDGWSGLTVGKSSDRVRLNVYDKLADLAKHDELYRHAYEQARCGGQLPLAATRVEYQVGRAWLSDYGKDEGDGTATTLDRVDDVLRAIPDIVQKLTASGEEVSYPFFRLTDRAPDRANKHQRRVGLDALWSSVVEAFGRCIVEPLGKLIRWERDAITPGKAVRTAVSYLTRIAASWKRLVETPDDAAEVLRDALRYEFGPEGSEEFVASKWEQQAKRLGVTEEVMRFDPERFDRTAVVWRIRRELEAIDGEECPVWGRFPSDGRIDPTRRLAAVL